MNNQFFTFMLFMMMDRKDRPIPFETVMSSNDMVPAPIRFAVQANTIQNVEAACLLEDKALGEELKTLVKDHLKGTFNKAAFPRIARLVA